jgi:hypothetical protein
MHIIVFAEILRHRRHHLPKLTLASQKKPNLLAAPTFFLRPHLLLRGPLLEILLNNNQPSYKKLTSATIEQKLYQIFLPPQLSSSGHISSSMNASLLEILLNNQTPINLNLKKLVSHKQL